MRDQEENEKDCPHCKRVNWLCNEMEEMGYEIDPDDIAAIDGLLDIYFYPFLMKLFGEIELLRFEYEEKHDEEKILGDYQNNWTPRRKRKMVQIKSKDREFFDQFEYYGKCIDCGGVNHPYMLSDEIWKKAVDKKPIRAKKNVFLCLF